MKRLFFLSLIVIAIISNSCNNSGDPRKGAMPNVAGSAGEVVVVIDKERWDGELGSKLKELLTDPVPGLPQSEPMFDVVNVTRTTFGDLYITHRNVIFVEIGTGKSQRAAFNSSVYSYSQLVITLEGESEEDIIALIEKQGKAIVDKINITERDRLVSYYKQSLNSQNYTNLRENHKLNLYVPSNFAMDVNDKGFVWLSYETPLTTQSILIHYFDYNGENYFNEDSLKAIRNNLTKARIKGPVDGTWMVIEDRLPVWFSAFRFRDRDYAEMKGLWTLENGFMGGPFITMATKDEVNNRFVMLDGYVYAPKDDKRELLRQVEAIMFTLSFDIGTEQPK